MRAKVCQSRKSKHSIMNHGGFGKLTVTRHGVTVEVPAEYLFEDGRIKKYAIVLIDKQIERELQLLEKEVC